MKKVKSETKTNKEFIAIANDVLEKEGYEKGIAGLNALHSDCGGGNCCGGGGNIDEEHCSAILTKAGEVFTRKKLSTTEELEVLEHLNYLSIIDELESFEEGYKRVCVDKIKLTKKFAEAHEKFRKILVAEVERLTMNLPEGKSFNVSSSEIVWCMPLEEEEGGSPSIIHYVNFDGATTSMDGHTDGENNSFDGLSTGVLCQIVEAISE